MEPDPSGLDQVHRTILAVWRIEHPRLITSLSKLLRDVPLAEELTQDALVIALERWPAMGIPERPGAWLMATAKRRALDHLRRAPMLTRACAMITAELEAEQQAMPDFDTAIDDDIGDEMLRLIFIACHPRLSHESRAALALRMICGLSTSEIARAFLQPEATIAQRIVRAKRTLSDAGLTYEIPQGHALSARVPSVLEVIYVIFNEGYTAARGDDWLRPQLCDEARRLCRILVAVRPNEAEAHSLVALMELTHARATARTGPDGEPILLFDQDRSLWDQMQIRRGMQALFRVRELGGAGGFYALQAEIAACHAQARVAEDTDWHRIAQLYFELSRTTGSPVVELNRAIAVSMTEGPAAGLAIIDRVDQHPALRRYHLLASTRGDLLYKLGRFEDARAAFLEASQLTSNRREQDLLIKRATDSASRLEQR
jgi:RNA polymerase sigma factor (sigma-70 family)